MSLRQKYLRVLSRIMPAGAVGASLLLAAAAPARPRSFRRTRNGRLRTVPLLPNGWPPFERRFPILPERPSDRAGEQQLAWGNWWRNGGWRNGGWGNWRNGWHNGGWHNWWHNW